MGDKEETTKGCQENTSTCGWQTHGKVGEQVTTGERFPLVVFVFTLVGAGIGKVSRRKVEQETKVHF